VWDGEKQSVKTLRDLLESAVSYGKGMEKAPARVAVEPAELGHTEVGAGGVGEPAIGAAESAARVRAEVEETELPRVMALAKGDNPPWALKQLQYLQDKYAGRGTAADEMR
jgi:hypothetical protein